MAIKLKKMMIIKPKKNGSNEAKRNSNDKLQKQ